MFFNLTNLHFISSRSGLTGHSYDRDNLSLIPIPLQRRYWCTFFRSLSSTEKNTPFVLVLEYFASPNLLVLLSTIHHAGYFFTNSMSEVLLFSRQIYQFEYFEHGF